MDRVLAVAMPDLGGHPKPASRGRLKTGQRSERSQIAARQAIVAILTPAQRSLVATTIGQLAITPERDRQSAARQIDATLSPAQREAIAGIIRNAAAQRETMFSEMIQETQHEAATLAQRSGKTPGGPPGIQRRTARTERAKHVTHADRPRPDGRSAHDPVRRPGPDACTGNARPRKRGGHGSSGSHDHERSADRPCAGADYSRSAKIAERHPATRQGPECWNDRKTGPAA